MQHVMLDLETWGTRPGCDLRSIGAVTFDPYSDRIDNVVGTFYLPTFNPWRIPGLLRRYRLTRDPNTVKWWSEQSLEAQSSFDDPIPLKEALIEFTYYLEGIGRPKEYTLWCNGPHFDEAILAYAYKACGLAVPWSHQAPRDFRTIMEAAGWPKVDRTGTVYHNALGDAIAQARTVQSAFAIIGDHRPPTERNT